MMVRRRGSAGRAARGHTGRGDTIWTLFDLFRYWNCLRDYFDTLLPHASCACNAVQMWTPGLRGARACPGVRLRRVSQPSIHFPCGVYTSGLNTASWGEGARVQPTLTAHG